MSRYNPGAGFALLVVRDYERRLLAGLVAAAIKQRQTKPTPGEGAANPLHILQKRSLKKEER